MEALSQADIIAGRFEILSPIRHGNMGEVLKARDLESEAGETVAVKLIWRRRSGEQVSLTEADKNAARFLREVRIMQRLSSPNLPRTIAGGLDGDRPYLAMEYIDGITLSELIDESGPVAGRVGRRDRRADREGAGCRAPGRRRAPGREAVQHHAGHQRAW